MSYETEQTDDDIRYLLTPEIRPADGESFTVIHRCSQASRKTAAANVPTTISALVDAASRTWAVVHG